MPDTVTDMMKSIVSSLNGLKVSARRRQTTPDLSRVLHKGADRRAKGKRHQDRPEQLNDWLRADLDMLLDTMANALENPKSKDARVAFERAIHNIYGASGAYGGGALTRLTGSLQRLVGNSGDISAIAPLINLHVRACISTVRATKHGGQTISDAVCDTIEARVDSAIERQKSKSDAPICDLDFEDEPDADDQAAA